MEKESFEDQRVAQLLNENFVSIKVDREERPDVDRIYTVIHLTLSTTMLPLFEKEKQCCLRDGLTMSSYFLFVFFICRHLCRLWQDMEDGL